MPAASPGFSYMLLKIRRITSFNPPDSSSLTLRQEKREVYYYEPCVKREEYIKDETKDFVDKFFRGSSRNLAAALVNSEALSKKELEELRDYFNQNC